MNGFMRKEQVDYYKNAYPKGTRIQVDGMENDPNPIPPGTKGMVNFVDDIGTLHCTFDNGRHLGVVPREDIFHKIYDHIPAAERYPLLIGHAVDGNRRLHSVKETADFILRHGKYGDVRITTEANIKVLDTDGVHIRNAYDAEYGAELQKILEPALEELQQSEEPEMSM